MTNEEFLAKAKETISTTGKIGSVSDGYHTYDELYHHRAMLFASICHMCPSLFWKSKKHDDGTMFDGMFIVGMNTDAGQATYHYDIDPYWDVFDCIVLDNAPVFDGHTPEDAIERIYDQCHKIYLSESIKGIYNRVENRERLEATPLDDTAKKELDELMEYTKRKAYEACN